MQIVRQSPLKSLSIAISCAVAVFFGLLFLARHVDAQSAAVESGQHLVTIHDGGSERGILTRAATLRDAFKEANIPIDSNDLIEPGLDEQLEASSYDVNVYRARPVTIVDGTTRVKVMSPYRTAKQIAKEAGIVLHDEDIVDMSASTDMVSQGAGVQLVVTRATEFTLSLYGKKTVAYTQAKTVAAMLKEKGITLGSNDTVSVAPNAPIAAGMSVDIWRNGVQTVTEEQAIPFATQQILDMDHPIGYRAVQTPGEPGTRMASYEVEMQDGKEVGRRQIQNVVSKQPTNQVELVGNKPVNPLSPSKGSQNFTDSKGVSHRETYYDLPMSKVMGKCGGGDYTIRADGAKVDRDGYILIAANAGRYPYCSIVETSMGLGKVYDTGGFAAVHPDGFDLATDWTNHDRR